MDESPVLNKVISGKTVKRVQLTNDYIRIYFSDGSELEVSVKLRDKGMHLEYYLHNRYLGG